MPTGPPRVANWPSRPTSRWSGIFGALAGAQSLNDFAVRTYADHGPAILHLTGERDYERLRVCGLAAGLRPPSVRRPLRRRAGGDRSRRVPRGRHRVGAQQ